MRIMKVRLSLAIYLSLCWILCFAQENNIQEFKIMGERNTGTRYLQQLLNKNLAINHLRLKVDGQKLNKMNELQKDHTYEQHEEFWGWKHACAPTRAYIGLHSEHASKILFVLTAKNPYSWLLSMWHHPYHYKGDKPATFDKFLRKPWGTVGRERFEGCGGEVKRHAKHQQFFKTPIDMWNKKLRSFAMISAMHVAKVRYEDLVDNPSVVVKKIRDRFLINSGTDSKQFENIVDSTKTKQKDFSAYREYYVKEKWKESWDCIPCLKFVNYGLEEEVMDMWDYPKWYGQPEDKVKHKLNGEPSWMLVARPGTEADEKKKKEGTFVSLNTLKRQKETAARLAQHRSKNNHLGHAPPIQQQVKASQVKTSPVKKSEVKKSEAWLKANVNTAYGEKPSHIAVGGPMSGLSIMS